MRRALLLACVLMLASCGGDDKDAREPAVAESDSPRRVLQLYDYDISAPFDEQELGAAQLGACAREVHVVLV
jgi:hypothetical protein